MLEAPEPLHACTFTGETRKMSDTAPFTVSSFYRFVSEKRLMAAKCNECGTEILPPKPMCTNCFSTNLKWIELDGAGKLLSYTIIYVAPEQFQSMAPYTVGIVELQNGLRLPGMIRGVNPEDIKIGMKLKIGFETSTSLQWPAWTRYFFKPA
jgi:uncharacterized OB-fold protein